MRIPAYPSPCRAIGDGIRPHAGTAGSWHVLDEAATTAIQRRAATAYVRARCGSDTELILSVLGLNAGP